MTLLVPRYIDAANIQDNTIRYRWDDWNVEQAEEPIDEEFYKRLEGVSQRSNAALTIATAEWIIHRFATFADITLPQQYVEAGWAQVVDFRYGAVHWDMYAEEQAWSGPVLRPIWTAMYRIQFALEVAKDDETPELRAAWITKLAPYLMTDPSPYQMWLNAVMARLQSLYRRDPLETLGEVVPREALDPQYPFAIEQTEPLINRFLSTLDYRSNPFLASPEAMLAEGLEGTAYAFSIQQDRKERFEW
jgi:hypothetical protein